MRDCRPLLRRTESVVHWCHYRREAFFSLSWHELSISHTSSDDAVN